MRVPRIRGLDKRSRPPVEEITSRLPVTQSPLWNRSTAGVYSAARTRGARQASDGGGQVICLRESIVPVPDCVGDYERVCKGEVTPVGHLAIVTPVERPQAAKALYFRSRSPPALGCARIRWCTYGKEPRCKDQRARAKSLFLSSFGPTTWV